MSSCHTDFAFRTSKAIDFRICTPSVRTGIDNGRNIGETSVTTNVTVTGLTPSSSQLQVGDDIGNRLHEFLGRYNPSQRHGGEEAEALAFGKVLGAVVTEVQLGNIAAS